MSLPSSGEISMHDINTEMSDTDLNSNEIKLAGGSTPLAISLFGAASSSVNKQAPHRMSEFHGYTHVGGGPPPPGGGGGGGLGGP
mgnify:CR=1 FL=1|jgi:hypothetical protein